MMEKIEKTEKKLERNAMGILMLGWSEVVIHGTIISVLTTCSLSSLPVPSWTDDGLPRASDRFRRRRTIVFDNLHYVGSCSWRKHQNCLEVFIERNQAYSCFTFP